MSVTQTKINSFRWKWVAITLLMFVLFYYFPLSVMPGGLLSNSIVTNTSIKLIGAWAFAGIFIIASVLGFIAKDFILKETTVSVLILCVLFLGSAQIKNNSSVEYSLAASVKIFIGIITLSIIAIIGSFCGAQIHKHGEKR